MSINYYDILGVDRKATEAEIKTAYRKQAIKWHPDKGGDEDKFKQVVEAYEVLSNLETRKEYDSCGYSNDFREKFASRFDCRLYLIRLKAYNKINSELVGCKVGTSAIHEIATKTKWPDDVFGHSCCSQDDYYNVFGHHSCCSQGNYSRHIKKCLESQNEIDDFVEKFLQVIRNYVSELKTFKEVAIKSVESYLKNNEENLDDDAKKLFEEKRWYNEKYNNWREYIKGEGLWTSKRLVSEFERKIMGVIDELIRNSKPKINQSNKSEAKETTEKTLADADSNLSQLLIEYQNSQPDEPPSYIPEFNQEENSSLLKDNSINPQVVNNSNNQNHTTEKSSLEEIIALGEKSLQIKQLNPQILAQLLAFQQANSPTYQELNQKGQVDKLIVDLQELEKNQQQSGKENCDNDQKFNIPTPLILFGVALVFFLSASIIIKTRKKN